MAVVEVFCRIGSSHATVRFNGHEYPALIGAGGPIMPHDKREGDGYTPLGRYPLLQGFYRADRGPQPNETFEWHVIKPGDSWNEDPHSDNYNQLEFINPKELGEGGMWKSGPQRDVLIIIGYNINPIVAGKGSALYIHPTPPGARESRGCVMLSLEDTRTIAGQLKPGDEIDIQLT
ncbi:MAG TPA: L,D-transpeptidase family protein [Alphaproteobacteria bacterium]|nr:L,D-transpeptidase family protein [Alphaproteobacteria bacterium]